MFYNIKIETISVHFNSRNQYLQSDCKFCKCYATHLLTRTSEVSDNTYSDRVCGQCAEKFK